MEAKVVDCALTERAKKKLNKHRERKMKDSSDVQVTETQGSREGLPPPRERGVIYLGHIPHGFYEEEMKSYFSQFGTVTRLKLYRSKKTGRSRGYAFIEFEFPEVAAIAAESMNNYLMYDKLLKCHVVEPNNVRRSMLTSGRAVVTVERTQRLARKEHNRPRTVSEAQRRLSRLLSREKRKRKRLAKLGLDYDFPGYRGISDVVATGKKATHITFTDIEEEEEGEGEGEEEGEGEGEEEGEGEGEKEGEGEGEEVEEDMGIDTVEGTESE